MGRVDAAIDDGNADALAGVADDYLRERAADIRDVARRVVQNLTGTKPSLLAGMNEKSVVVAREAITTVPDEDFGEVRVQNVVPKFSRNPGEVRHTARDIGADNATVFGEYLGLDADELALLAEKDII